MVEPWVTIGREAAAAGYELRGAKSREEILSGRVDGSRMVSERIECARLGYFAAKREDAEIARNCSIGIRLGTPGQGPFTTQDNAVADAREAIATAIRALIEQERSNG